MVSKRRSLLDYIKAKDAQEYLSLIDSLNIRKYIYVYTKGTNR